MHEFLIDQKEWIIGIIGSVVMFFGGRKSKKITDKTGELENLEAVRKIEKQLIEDIKSQIDELRETNSGLQLIINQKDELIGAQQEVIDQQRELYIQQAREFEEFKKSCSCRAVEE